jgi:hypothetical protein
MPQGIIDNMMTQEKNYKYEVKSKTSYLGKMQRRSCPTGPIQRPISVSGSKNRE